MGVAVPQVVIVEVGAPRIGNGFCGGFRDVAIKFLGLATTDGICDESDEENDTDETNDGEDTCYGTFVLEEPVGT